MKQSFGVNVLGYHNFFPYEKYRESQEHVIQQIEQAARDKKIILLSAPNGTGKTIIALSALLPVAIEKNLKIIYTCRTHAQNTRVIKELRKISQFYKSKGNSDVILNGLSIRGRNEMCLNKTLLGMKANPREAMSICRDLRNNKNCSHFTNLVKKRSEKDNPILIAPELFEKPVDAEELIKFCNEKRICPYFLSKFLLKEMKIIICNYQWVFNPFIRETFMKFIGKDLENSILIVDECHNLIDVATEVNSERITPYSLKQCFKDMEMYSGSQSMRNFIEFLESHLENRKTSMTSEEKPVNARKLLNMICKRLGLPDLTAFKNLLVEIHDFSVAVHNERVDNGQISRDFVGSFAEFWLKWLDTYELPNYFHSYALKEINEKRTISLEIVALDPREISIPVAKQSYSCLHLSGTVNPYVYNNLMGFNESGKRYKGLIANSPFQKKNIKAIITEGIDTKRENRNPFMFKKMVNRINEVLKCTPANTGIFCASYKILRGLLSNELEKAVMRNNKKLFVEEPGMSASENIALVEDFKSMSEVKNSGGVLLGVCGGRNSEGEDYPGDHMNSVVIAGFPYHLPTPRINAKIDYYDKVFESQGWNFAYLYPAIQRANQASGRPIRKANDKGSMIFMDSRFKEKYQWISDWVRKEIEIVPDQDNALTQHLYPFWNSQ